LRLTPASVTSVFIGGYRLKRALFRAVTLADFLNQARADAGPNVW
jgi:hypothetical protein